MEILEGLKDAVLVVELVSDDVDSINELIAQNCDFVVESHKTDSLEWVVFLDFLELGFNGAQYALFSGDEGLVLVVLAGHPVELSLISRLHELSEHVKFLLAHSELEINFSLDLCGSVHAARHVDTKNHGLVLF